MAAMSIDPRPITADQSAGESVLLVPLSEEHLDNTLKWVNDPRVSRPFLLERTIDPEAHRVWFQQLQKTQKEFIYAIIGPDHRHIGNLGFKCLDEPAPELWMYLDPELHNQGFGKLAAVEGVKVGLHAFRRESLILAVSEQNIAAQKIYRHAGFKVSPDWNKQRWVWGDRDDLVPMRLDRSQSPAGGRRVAMMQPMFLPWLGLFELIEAADVFIFLDDFQFSRQGWGHRNRLFLSPGKPGLISLPVSHPKNLDATFRDIYPTPDQRWVRKTKTTLHQVYGKREWFEQTFNVIEPYLDLVGKGNVSLANIEIGLTKKLAGLLGISAEFRLSSEFDVGSLNRSEKILAMIEQVGGSVYYAAAGSLNYMIEDALFDNNGPDVFFQSFVPRQYHQDGAEDFEPRLSVVDALFNLGAVATAPLVNGTRRWISLAEQIHLLGATQDFQQQNPA